MILYWVEAIPLPKLEQTTWILTLAALNNVVESEYFTLDKDKLDGPALLAPESVV